MYLAETAGLTTFHKLDNFKHGHLDGLIRIQGKFLKL